MVTSTEKQDADLQCFPCNPSSAFRNPARKLQTSPPRGFAAKSSTTVTSPLSPVKTPPLINVSTVSIFLPCGDSTIYLVKSHYSLHVASIHASASSWSLIQVWPYGVRGRLYIDFTYGFVGATLGVLIVGFLDIIVRIKKRYGIVTLGKETRAAIYVQAANLRQTTDFLNLGAVMVNVQDLDCPNQRKIQNSMFPSSSLSLKKAKQEKPVFAATTESLQQRSKTIQQKAIHSTAVGGDAAIVVAPLVTSQGLSGGEGLVADGALVGPTPAVGCGRCRGCCGGGGGRGSGGILVAAGLPPVTGLVSTQRLIRPKSLVTHAALVDKLGFRRNRLRLRPRWSQRLVVALRGGGRGGVGHSTATPAPASCEHDKAESQILLFSRLVIHTRSLRALALGPRLQIPVAERRCWCCWGIQSLKSHY
ncbi:hypothetical protein RJ639_038243 [Escallonia herrerae]|uniref:Uncharacterized protein n=1 Tax=Escallonia herrerae TaxID=1293975 RepID=A0AA88WL64_9ASTE|nr:hypothetical protein RJ639_038243 [Escallonia herrerae]